MADPTIIKPPDADDTSIAFDFPKKRAPYVRDLFDALKREGETLDAWVCRFVEEAAARLALQSKDAELRDEANTKVTTDSATLAAEHTSILS